MHQEVKKVVHKNTINFGRASTAIYFSSHFTDEETDQEKDNNQLSKAFIKTFSLSNHFSKLTISTTNNSVSLLSKMA